MMSQIPDDKLEKGLKQRRAIFAGVSLIPTAALIYYSFNLASYLFNTYASFKVDQYSSLSEETQRGLNGLAAQIGISLLTPYILVSLAVAAVFWFLAWRNHWAINFNRQQAKMLGKLAELQSADPKSSVDAQA